MDPKTSILSTNNPNIFGEFIRDYAFVKEDEYSFGCYNAFRLRPEFKAIDKDSKEGQELMSLLSFDPDEIDEVKSGSSLYTDGTFIVAWYWDHDGTLLVGCEDKMAINDDCKKDHKWEWL